VFIHYQLVINLQQSKTCPNEALLFPKKLVFRVGKKAVESRQALPVKFGLQGWALCVLRDVLGCVG